MLQHYLYVRSVAISSKLKGVEQGKQTEFKQFDMDVQ